MPARGPLLRQKTIIATVLTLVLVTASTAFASGHDEWAAHADGEGFLLQIPEVLDVGGGVTEADLSSDPTAHARGVGFLLSDDSISEVTIDKDGVSQRDPAEGSNCAAPSLPEPVDLLDSGCSYALGDTTGSNSNSEASAAGARLAVTGADVAALIGFLLSQIDGSPIGEAVDQIEQEAIEPAIQAFADACVQLEDSPLGGLGTTAGELITAIEEGGAPIDVQLDPEEPCTFLVQYITDPPVLTDDPVAAIQSALTQALDGVSILDVLLAGSESTTTETDAAVTAAAEAIGMDVALPSLNLLGNLTQLVTTLVTDFLNTVNDDLGELTPPEPLPTPGEAITTIMDSIPQELQDVLGSTDPLLRITGGKASPTATYDRDAEDATTSGTVAPLIIDLNDDLATLLGISDQDPITIPEGGSETIAADTPLESTFTLSACTTEDDIENSDGIPGARIHCAGLELVLLKGVIGDDPDTEEFDGGLRLAGAAATAEVYGQALAAPADDDPEDMPTTGGGLALLGLVAVGGAVALRRRD